MIHQKRDWRVTVVLHYVAKLLGVKIKVDGCPYGADILAKPHRRGYGHEISKDAAITQRDF
ncbi:hypothetical protein [Thalassospira marina]|uniref:Uncharacterized protein n=1 Tax=Thalassospira marina TaxID=2048283 RepID=A0A2N3KY40_9PROT|nr:hypothetical protein [Thalassospira marina]PKR55397.1 hypothetical protein COO20_04300 [Thalassospira marina]